MAQAKSLMNNNLQCSFDLKAPCVNQMKRKSSGFPRICPLRVGMLTILWYFLCQMHICRKLDLSL